MPRPPESPTDSPRPPGRRRRLWPKLLLALVTFGVATIVADRVIGGFNLFGVRYAEESHRYRAALTELVIRHPDGSLDLDGELFRQRPGATTEFSDFSVRINSLGFRGPEASRKKPAGVYRIVALGDSVSFGWGVDDEHTYLRMLEVELNRQIEGHRFEVINTGHPMYDTVQECAMLERHAMVLDPDLVILTYVVNDIDPTRDVVEQYLAAVEKPVSDPSPEPVGESFLAWALPSFTQLYRYGARRLAAPRGKADPALMREFVKGRQRGWDRSKQALLKIRDLCKSRGVPLLVLDNTAPRIAELAEFCTEQQIPCFDLRLTEEETAMPVYNSLLDPHNNALGNQLLLDKLKVALRDAGLFDLR